MSENPPGKKLSRWGSESFILIKESFSKKIYSIISVQSTAIADLLEGESTDFISETETSFFKSCMLLDQRCCNTWNLDCHVFIKTVRHF